MPRQILEKQNQLKAFETQAGFKGEPAPHPRSDVTAFIITTLDSENGQEVSVLELAGTHRPHQPFTHGVSQEVYKFYYPGGENRRPTIQVLGGIDEDVNLKGSFVISGGYDSILLLLVAVHIYSVSKQKFTIIHCNHIWQKR